MELPFVNLGCRHSPSARGGRNFVFLNLKKVLHRTDNMVVTLILFILATSSIKLVSNLCMVTTNKPSI